MKIAIYSEEDGNWTFYDLQENDLPRLGHGRKTFSFEEVIRDYGRNLGVRTFSSQGQTAPNSTEDALTQRILDFGKLIREFRK